MNKTIIHFLFLFFHFSASSQNDSKKQFLTESIKNCINYADSVYGGDASVQDFERIVLGMKIDSLEKLDTLNQKLIFEDLFSKTNADYSENYLNNNLESNLCNLYNKYIIRVKELETHLDFFNSMLLDSLNKDEYSYKLILVEFCYFSKRKIIKLFEDNLGIGRYEIIEGDLFLAEREDKRGKVKDWQNLKTWIVNPYLKEVKDYYFQYDMIKLYPDDCTDMVLVINNEKLNYFYYYDLEHDFENNAKIPPLGQAILELKQSIKERTN